MEDNPSITQLIDYVTSEVIETPDINAQIEIASRMVDNLKDMVVGMRDIDKIMRKGRIKRKLFALMLIEVCSKNGDLKLHEQFTKQKFLDSFMNLLKAKRGKKGLLIGKEKGINKVYKEKAEIKALYLIQLWADTFMMYQDRFSGVHECYKLLRKEGVEFPPRDPNERLMMENLKGIDSPMFDFIEQTAGKEKPKDLDEIKREKIAEEMNKTVDIIENDDKEEIAAFAENEDFSKFTRDNYDKTEFEIAKSTIMILEDMSNNAEHINDLRTEVVKDIYDTCKVSRLRIAKIVEVRSYANKLTDLESLLEVLDFMDKKLDAFRAKYKKLKDKEQKRLKRQTEREQQEKAKKKQQETIKQESSDEDDEGEEEEYEDDEFDQYNKEDPSGAEIGGIDLLDLGLNSTPEKQQQKQKDQEQVKQKKSRKKSTKSKKKSEKLDKAKADAEQDNGDPGSSGAKPIKKLIAPPSGARKLNNAERSSSVQEEAPAEKKQDIMDLLEF